MEKLQPVRGTKDLFAAEYALHEYIVNIAKKVASNYGYQGITTPIFEFSNVFKRSLGDTSDIVGKEMYSFADKGNEEITLRPEFTASICRAYISNGFKQLLPLKLFTHGPLFRYERPQKGRQRQFHQVNYELLGLNSPAVDAEVIAMAAQLLESLGILAKTNLELNSLGCRDTRKNYQVSLVEYLQDYAEGLSEDSKIRLLKNPMRILDSKDENDRKILLNAPKINNHFTSESADFFAQLQEYLKAMEIEFKINSNLVRGLDYYNHTTFEFTSNDLGAQSAVLGGGRYNGLIKQLGGDDVDAIGFAAGIERLALLCALPETKARAVAVIAIDPAQQKQAMKIANQLRQSDINILTDLDTKFDKALKNAVKANCNQVIFVGEEELKNNCVKIKNLDTRVEEVIKLEELIGRVK